MSLVVAVWAMLASACLTLAFTSIVIGAKQPALRSHLLFAGAAIAVAAVAIFELMLMRSQSITEYARLHRWAHVPLFLMFVCAVFFVREYFCAGRLWLAWLVCGVRFLALVASFTTGASLNYGEITSLRQLSFLGETITFAHGTSNPWGWLGPLSSLLYVSYVADASVATWRSGSPMARRRAVLVGGSIILFIVAATLHSQLVIRGIIQSPYLISAAFFGTILVMAYELGADVARSAELSRELANTQRRMQLAVEAAGIGLWEWDIIRDRIHFIHGGEAMFGEAAGDVMNIEAFLAAVHPDDREAVRASIQRSLETGADCWLEFRIRGQNPGETRWIGSRGGVEPADRGKPVLMRGVVYDITQRRQAQERVRVVLDAAPNGFLMIGADGSIVMTNAQTERIFGYAAGELVGRHVDVLVPEHLRETHILQRRTYFASPTIRSMASRDVVGRRKDGGEVALEIGLTPVHTSEGQFVLAAIVDVTEQRRLRREVAQRRDELAHLSRVAVLGELSGSLAHELKQPLTAILSSAQAAQRFSQHGAEGLPELEAALADIVEDTKRASDLIDRLRELFRSGATERRALDLNEVVEHVLTIMRSELNARGLIPAVSLAADMPKIVGDPVQLQQVLINLIMNAAEAMRHVDPKNQALVVRTARQGSDRVEVCVSDTGHGIAAGDLEHIFEPFVTHRKEGLGLGLTVCRTIVEAHGGTVSAENNSDRGATFRVTLPAVKHDDLVALG